MKKSNTKTKPQPTKASKQIGRKMDLVKGKRVFVDNLALVGSVWYYRFKKINKVTGKTKVYQGSTALSSKTEAKARLRQLMDEAEKESLTIKSAQVPTFKEAVDLWYNNRKGKRSELYLNTAKRQLENHVIPKIGAIRCDQINFAIVEVVLNDYLHGNNMQYTNKKHNAGGYNTLASWISAVLGNLVPSYLDRAPVIRKERLQKKKKPFIREDQIDDFLAEVDRTNNLPVSVAVRAQLYMGLRECEALGLKWENINWKDGTYCPGGIVGSSLDDGTKGKEATDCAFPEQMAVWLRKAQKVQEAEEAKAKSEGKPYQKPQYIIPQPGTDIPHCRQYTKKVIVRAGAKIGVRLSPHRCRGTYATLLARNGENAFVVQQAGRWKDIKTAEGYVELGIEDVKKANQRLWEPKKVV